MKIKDIEKLTKKIEELKSIDSEILRLEKFANNLIESVGSFKVELTISRPKIKGKNDILDSDGSLINNDSISNIYPYGLPLFSFSLGNKLNEIKKDTDEYKYEQSISETVMLNILAFLISEKNKLRNAILIELDKNGIR